MAVHAVSGNQAEPLEAGESLTVDGMLQAAEGQRLVQPESEHDPLAAARVGVERLELARRLLAPGESGKVRPEPRPVPSPDRLDRRDRADSESEVVLSEPVPEVVPGPKVPRVAGARVLYHDGVPVASWVGGQVEWLESVDEKSLPTLARVLSLDPLQRSIERVV